MKNKVTSYLIREIRKDWEGSSHVLFEAVLKFNQEKPKEFMHYQDVLCP